MDAGGDIESADCKEDVKASVEMSRVLRDVIVRLGADGRLSWAEQERPTWSDIR